MQLKIAFFGLDGSFNYTRVGGTESVIRRISVEMSMNTGVKKVSCYHYGSLKKSSIMLDGVSVESRVSFLSMLKGLIVHDVCICVYIKKRHRLFMWLVRLFFRNKKFIFLSQGYPTKVMSKMVLLMTAHPFFGYSKVVTLSKKTSNFLYKYNLESLYIPPPIPDKYILNSIKNLDTDLIRVAFAGRADIEKGFDIILNIFSIIEKNPNIQTSIYTYKVEDVNFLSDLNNTQINIHDMSSTFSKKVESDFFKTLQNIDVLILPYSELNRTIDPPLLVLEGMASGCSVVTISVGDLGQIFSSLSTVFNSQGELYKYVLKNYQGEVNMKNLLINKNQNLREIKLLNNSSASVTKAILNEIHDLF